MVALGRQEKEELVWDLYYNQGKTYREITKLARISPRDIKGILNRDTQNAEQKRSKSEAAYEMFSKGKSPVEVAIALDLRESDVTQLYKESWNLKQIHDLNKIYLDTGGDLEPFVKLCKLSKAGGFNEEHLVWLLKVANNDLPALETRYYRQKSELDSV